MGISCALIAALFAAMQNFFMRKSVHARGANFWYLPIQLLISCVVAILLNPVRTQCYTFDPYSFVIGGGMGVLLGLMLWALNQALYYGSSAMTFGILNCYSVFPALLMYLLFGEEMGHPYYIWHLIGSLVVIAGILWGAQSESTQATHFSKWLILSLVAMGAHIFFSTLAQWKILLERYGGGTFPLLPFSLRPEEGQWFNPAIFAGALMVQLWVMLRAAKWEMPSLSVLLYGVLGGMANGSSMYFLLLATGVAEGWENAVLFPIFSISIIQICNMFGQFYYKERVAWRPSLVCVAGILLATVNWKALL